MFYFHTLTLASDSRSSQPHTCGNRLTQADLPKLRVCPKEQGGGVSVSRAVLPEGRREWLCALVLAWALCLGSKDALTRSYLVAPAVGMGLRLPLLEG